MSGVSIIRTLLVANSSLLAVVPAEKIMAGVIPIGTVLPAIGITSISGMPKSTIRTDEVTLWTDRVQVTVEAKSYPSQKSILALVRDAIPAKRGTVGSFYCDSISPDIEGPDIFDSEPAISAGSQDFLVRYVR
jgi:hypothetical protein